MTVLWNFPKNKLQYGCFPRKAILRISTCELTSLLFLHFLSVNHWYSQWACIHFFRSCLELWHYRNLDLPENKINKSSCRSFKTSKNNSKLIMGKCFKIYIYYQLIEINQLITINWKSGLSLTDEQMPVLVPMLA